MKVGDLIVAKEALSGSDKLPVLLVLNIKQHHESSDRDRITLQWLPSNGEAGIRGEYSRLIVERKYKVV
tara:strand:+ start:1552 stop:1758 length:207 start_codon:yes stop_codon:yes gene_type:complete